MPFKIPLDAYVLAVPMAYACAALGGLIYKTLSGDPEMSTMKYYESTPEDKVAATGSRYNDSVREMFLNRIRQNKTGFFVNDLSSEFKA